MTEKEQTEHFETELRKLVDRFRWEYNLSYAMAIGVLTLKIADLAREAMLEE